MRVQRQFNYAHCSQLSCSHYKQFFKILLLFILLIFMASLASAQTKISGLAFGDYYYVSENHNQELEGKNGFQFRRVYVTFDHQFEEESLSARVRFEVNSPGNFKSTTKLEPYVKHLYLKWKANRNHELYLGLSSPPTFAVVEEIWGYRHLEKTPLDLYKFGPSSDIGVAIKGNLNNHFKYHGMFSNGSGTSAEINPGKKASFSLGYYLNTTFLVEGYVDTEYRSDSAERQTYQLFSAVKNDNGRIGLLLTRQHRDELNFNDNLDLASVFAVCDLNSRVALISRYDRMFNPNPSGESIAYLPFDSKARSNFVLLGIEYKATPNLSLIPNIEYTSYAGTTPTPKDDLIPRFTFYFTF